MNKPYEEWDKQIERSKINLCSTCYLEPATCPALPSDIEWGDGVGNDNVIGCEFYAKDGGKGE